MDNRLMKGTGKPAPSIALPGEVVASLVGITEAIGTPVVLVGGWAVRCRLQMARSAARPTDDLDVLLGSHARPARAALEAIGAVQSDPAHPCRLEGLSMLVDLLADDVPDASAPLAPGRQDVRVEDADGLQLLVPPFARLLVRTAEPVRFVAMDREDSCVVLVPRAGAVMAAKVANITLEFRTPEKRATDGEDAVRLVDAFGSLALLADLDEATSDERTDLHHHLVQVGAGGVAGQARAAGHPHDRPRLEDAIGKMIEVLRPHT